VGEGGLDRGQVGGDGYGRGSDVDGKVGEGGGRVVDEANL